MKKLILIFFILCLMTYSIFNQEKEFNTNIKFNTYEDYIKNNKKPNTIYNNKIKKGYTFLATKNYSDAFLQFKKALSLGCNDIMIYQDTLLCLAKITDENYVLSDFINSYHINKKSNSYLFLANYFIGQKKYLNACTFIEYLDTPKDVYFFIAKELLKKNEMDVILFFFEKSGKYQEGLEITFNYCLNNNIPDEIFPYIKDNEIFIKKMADYYYEKNEIQKAIDKYRLIGLNEKVEELLKIKKEQDKIILKDFVGLYYNEKSVLFIYIDYDYFYFWNFVNVNAEPIKYKYDLRNNTLKITESRTVSYSISINSDFSILTVSGFWIGELNYKKLSKDYKDYERLIKDMKNKSELIN